MFDDLKKMFSKKIYVFNFLKKGKDPDTYSIVTNRSGGGSGMLKTYGSGTLQNMLNLLNIIVYTGYPVFMFGGG
jgi:hypothetical protein